MLFKSICVSSEMAFIFSHLDFNQSFATIHLNVYKKTKWFTSYANPIPSVVIRKIPVDNSLIF